MDKENYFKSGGVFPAKNVARFPNHGVDIVPESPKEEEFLFDLASNPERTSDEKMRIAHIASLFPPTAFDVNFTNTRRESLPTELDDKLLELIKGM